MYFPKFNLENQITYNFLLTDCMLFRCGQCRMEEDWRKLQNLIEFHESNEPPNISQRETLYKCPPTKQTLVKLLLINQEAIGFYIVRLKGLFLPI